MFIHSHGKKQDTLTDTYVENLIEKTLGDEETIQINKECLIGFSEGIRIQEPHQSFFNKKEFVTVKGPGLIYIETSVQSEGFIEKVFTKKEQTR
jgi:uncharacterized protein (AIM24 family)